MQKLQSTLKERGISRLQLAMGAGVTPSDLYNALNGNRPFYPAWRQRISEFLDIPENDLFEEVRPNDTNSNT